MELTIAETLREVGIVPIVLVLSTTVFLVALIYAQSPALKEPQTTGGALAAAFTIVFSGPFILILMAAQGEYPMLAVGLTLYFGWVFLYVPKRERSRIVLVIVGLGFPLAFSNLFVSWWQLAATGIAAAGCTIWCLSRPVKWEEITGRTAVFGGALHVVLCALGVIYLCCMPPLGMFVPEPLTLAWHLRSDFDARYGPITIAERGKYRVVQFAKDDPIWEHTLAERLLAAERRSPELLRDSRSFASRARALDSGRRTLALWDRVERRLVVEHYDFRFSGQDVQAYALPQGSEVKDADIKQAARELIAACRIIL
jgi:hypothetical protein